VTGKNLVGPEADALDLGAVFRALADEHRRSVLTQLAADRSDNERGCNSFDLPVSKQTQTHHFRVLREAGLIDEPTTATARASVYDARTSRRDSPGCSPSSKQSLRAIPLLAKHR
jgi:DNA-binding transcriptional ArsR family regulator